MAAFYMKGEAPSWFKWMYHNSQLSDWPSFLRALELRFGPSTYENYQAELFKLRQHNSVCEYQSQFERLSNRVYGLTPDALLNCFISGLHPDIRKEIAIIRPTSITQAIGVAKLVEAKIKDSKPKTFRSNYPFHTTPSVPTPSRPNPMTPNLPPTPPIRRLSPAQLQERRAQGLCYNCDEKYIPGHKCTTPKFLLLMTEEDEPPTQDQTLIEEAPIEEYQPVHFQ